MTEQSGLTARGLGYHYLVTTQTLLASEDAPATARRLVHDELEAWGYPSDVTESAERLVSEVVTDALRQRPTLVTVSVEPTAARTLHIEVANGPEPSVVGGDPSDAVQRGIAHRCVARLADRWATELDRTRTTTWFERSA
jgi:hypothetical protein